MKTFKELCQELNEMIKPVPIEYHHPNRPSPRNPYPGIPHEYHDLIRQWLKDKHRKPPAIPQEPMREEELGEMIRPSFPIEHDWRIDDFPRPPRPYRPGRPEPRSPIWDSPYPNRPSPRNPYPGIPHEYHDLIRQWLRDRHRKSQIPKEPMREEEDKLQKLRERLKKLRGGGHRPLGPVATGDFPSHFDPKHWSNQPRRPEPHDPSPKDWPNHPFFRPHRPRN